MRFVDVKCDIAFKRIFGNEGKKEILISFLNAVLDLSGDREIGDITILNPYQVPNRDGLKETVLDIRAMDKEGVTFIIEIQVQRKKGFEKRVLYYTGKAYINQLNVGDDYTKLRPVIYIGIVDFEIFEGNHYLTRHLILNTKTFKQNLKDFEFYFIELPKFKKAENEVEGITEKWVYFIKNAYSLEMVPKCADFVEIKDAYDIANEMTWTRKDFEVYEYWQIRAQDEKGTIEYAVEKAIEKEVEKAERAIEHTREQSLIEGERKGLIKGIEGMLDLKYGTEGLELMDMVRAIDDLSKLDEFKELIKKSTSITELRAYLV